MTDVRPNRLDQTPDGRQEHARELVARQRDKAVDGGGTWQAWEWIRQLIEDPNVAAMQRRAESAELDWQASERVSLEFDKCWDRIADALEHPADDEVEPHDIAERVIAALNSLKRVGAVAEQLDKLFPASPDERDVITAAVAELRDIAGVAR